MHNMQSGLGTLAILDLGPIVHCSIFFLPATTKYAALSPMYLDTKDHMYGPGILVGHGLYHVVKSYPPEKQLP